MTQAGSRRLSTTSSSRATGGSRTSDPVAGHRMRFGERPQARRWIDPGSGRCPSSIPVRTDGVTRRPSPSNIAADPPDAVICYDDKLALSILDALRSTAVEVPGDLALVGFDGIPAARQSRPRLTTVAVPSVEIGRRAVEMLVGSRRDGGPPPSEVMPVRLVVGESTPPASTTAEATPVGPRRVAAG